MSFFIVFMSFFISCFFSFEKHGEGEPFAFAMFALCGSPYCVGISSVASTLTLIQ